MRSVEVEASTVASISDRCPARIVGGGVQVSLYAE
jgi:hypothetical protein